MQAKDFIDARIVRVTGGKGGDGCISFLSLYKKEFAGPDGGDGGNGGHVLFEVCLLNYRNLYVTAHFGIQCECVNVSGS